MMRRLIAHFGSLRTTLVLLAALAAAVALQPTWTPLALVFGALALNLLAALVVHPAFRRQLPLLVFHLALLALLVLAGIGRMSALDARFELTQGLEFDGDVIEAQAGVLHSPRLAALRFRNEGFEIDYAPGRLRGATRNQVAWHDEQGRPQTATIGDHRPLVLDGHRIYTTPNKGFAPLLRWDPASGPPQAGVVHLPSFPLHELQQSREWALPDGRTVWVQLDLDESLIDPAQHTAFQQPTRPRLVVRVGEQRAVLEPGAGMALPGGRLSFVELRSWMGYRISYDPTLPWLLAASLLAALSLGWHYRRKFATDEPGRTTALRGATDGC